MWNLPRPGIEPVSPAWQADSLTIGPPEKSSLASSPGHFDSVRPDFPSTSIHDILSNWKGPFYSQLLNLVCFVFLKPSSNTTCFEKPSMILMCGRISIICTLRYFFIPFAPWCANSRFTSCYVLAAPINGARVLIIIVFLVLHTVFDKQGGPINRK